MALRTTREESSRCGVFISARTDLTQQRQRFVASLSFIDGSRAQVWHTSHQSHAVFGSGGGGGDGGATTTVPPVVFKAIVLGERWPVSCRWAYIPGASVGTSFKVGGKDVAIHPSQTRGRRCGWGPDAV